MGPLLQRVCLVGSRWWGMPGPGGGVSHPTLSRFRQLRVCAILSLKICEKAQWSGSHQGMEESHMWPHSCQRHWRSGWQAGSRTMENHTELALMCCTSYISIHVKVKMYLKVIVLSMLVVSCVQKLKQRNSTEHEKGETGEACAAPNHSHSNGNVAGSSLAPC